MTEAACVGHGPLDAYGFHLLETLQCMVERRKGGETGVREVEWIEGDRIWEWLDNGGRWAKSLLATAFSHQKNPPPTSLMQAAKTPVLFRIDYRDGFRAAALMLTPSGNDRTVAIRTVGDSAPLVTLFGPRTQRPLPHFDGFVRCAEEMFVTGKEPYPPERTLLTTGMLAFLFQSKAAKAPRPTPELAVTYRAPANVFYQNA